MSTALKIILDDFADFNDMHRIARDVHGVYTLVFDHRWVVNIESDPLTQAVCLFASPGSVAPDRQITDAETPDVPIYWYQIREEQLPFGGRIGAHRMSGLVMLDSQCDSAELDSVAFRKWLLGFVDQLQWWTQRLKQTGSAEALPFGAGPAAWRAETLVPETPTQNKLIEQRRHKATANNV